MATLDLTSSSAVFSTGSSTYDVFVSFRGDTRYNFTSFLIRALKNRGINVFSDTKDLWNGEAIDPALLRAIEGSKIFIPVFSKDYANSAWCLLEIAQIFQCHRSNRQKILPIYFKVVPNDVQNQEGSFKEAFLKHEKNFEPHIVEGWREALREIGKLRGEVIDKKTDQAEIVESFVKRVLDELISSMHFAGCKYPIGMESHENHIVSLLHIDSNDIQFVGIYGFSGIGKTTIAKVIYKKVHSHFKRHCFLSDVRGHAKKSLQKQLLKDIFWMDIEIRDCDIGKQLIKERLCKEKVLLVLDDVDCKEQVDALAGELNWFGAGSRVIITTRDEEILNAAKVGKDKRYLPQVLDSKQSLQLFSLHAFSMDRPPERYIQLSRDMARYSGGLPLALEVLGSSLSNERSEEVWKSTLQNWKKNSHKKVHERLKISYDNLDDCQKTIFLDVACFFVGWKKENVISIWEACGYYPLSAIHILIQWSLLKIEDNKCSGCYYLRMHDLIRDMGREIVSKENTYPGKRSRLWLEHEVLEVLEEHKGTDSISSMIIPPGLSSLSNQHFERMSNLKLLDFHSKNFEGDVSGLPSGLRWLRWSNCPWVILPTNFYHDRLVHLDLSWTKIEQAWNIRPQDENKRFQKLRVLDLHDCIYLSKSPDFSWFPYLEQLDLGHCNSLDMLDESIGQLSQLKCLILNSCWSIKELPISIGDLKSLVKLDLSSTLLEELPNSISRLSSLKELILRECRSLKKLSDGVELLEKLEVLDAKDCHELVKLPDLSRLKSLRELELLNCKNLEEIRGLEGTLSLVEFNGKGCYNLTRTPRKIHGQGRFLRDDLRLEKPIQLADGYNFTADDGIYNKNLILCLVLNFRVNDELELGQLLNINLDISASIQQRSKTAINCIHTLRIEKVEFTDREDIIYLHHFKGLDWFGIPLQGKFHIDFTCTYPKGYFNVKFMKVLIENREQHSSASVLTDFFSWSCRHDDDVQGLPSDTEGVEERVIKQ